jgi:hypothetical protein
MQNFGTLRQPLLGELAMSCREERFFLHSFFDKMRTEEEKEIYHHGKAIKVNEV